VGVELEAPLWLLALPLFGIGLVLARLDWWGVAASQPRSALFRTESRRLLFRLAWMSLVVLALAGTSVVRPLDRQSTVMVLDTSASMNTVRDQVEAAARDAATALHSGDQLGVVATADGASVEETPTERPLFAHVGAQHGDGGSTDLAAGLHLAGALLPRDFSRRVVLVSDGRQTRGDAVGTARELSAAGTVVDVLPVGEAEAADVRLEAVDLPRTAYQGEVAILTARVSADRATPATVRVWRDDGQLALERGVQLVSGPQELALPLPAAEDPGLHRYRVDVDVADRDSDATPINNTLGAVERVSGPPRVLVLANQPQDAASLVGALQAGGADVQLAQPAAAPTDLAGWAAYQSVVLVDVAADALPAGALDQLEAFVRDLGRGLGMVGGPNSFGAGGYAGTGVERALPVYMDVRGRGRQPRVALALVIDKSGSMNGPKIEMAKEAAVRSLAVLGPLDQAAVLTFDTVPQWVAPPTPLTDEGRQQLDDAIGSITADGGTEIYPAVAAAFESLREVDADVKHLIVLTDGQDAGANSYQSLLDEMRAAQVTVSTVAVGDDADQGLLSALARAGRGRFHFTNNPADIPDIFTRETLMATRALLVDTRFYPAVATQSPLLRGLSTTPPIDGYIAVTPKERSEVALVSPDGDPVLAAWQYGGGRAVAWTSDVGGRWTTAWAGAPVTATLWGNVLSWLLPAETQGPLSVSIDAAAAEGTATVTADLPTAASVDWTTVRPTRARVIAPDGTAQEVDLSPAGPGRYQASFAAPQSGAYVAQVTHDLGDGATLSAEAGWVAPYAAEFRQVGTDRAFLEQVAAAGGGHVLDAARLASRPAEHPTQARWPAWPFLVVVAGILWPIEIAVRRFSPPPLALPSRPRSQPRTTMDPTSATADRLLTAARSRRHRITGR
jgi:Mg-chelatase subunit ChlD